MKKLIMVNFKVKRKENIGFVVMRTIIKPIILMKINLRKNLEKLRNKIK